MSEGHSVIATARSKEALEHLQAVAPMQIRIIVGDITDPTLAKRLVETAESEWGTLDGLVINQGTMDPVTRIAASKAQDWKTCFDINVFSAISLVGSKLPTTAIS